MKPMEKWCVNVALNEKDLEKALDALQNAMEARKTVQRAFEEAKEEEVRALNRALLLNKRRQALRLTKPA